MSGCWQSERRAKRPEAKPTTRTSRPRFRARSRQQEPSYGRQEMKPKIFIDGEHGTTGLQIRALLADRRDLEIISIPSERRKEAAARAEFLNAADVAILCLPD